MGAVMSQAGDLAVCPACKQPECECSEELVREALRRAEAGLDEVVIASDTVQQARRKKAGEKAERQRKDDINWLMRHPQGRRIMWELLERCSIFQNAAVRGRFENSATMFHLGESNIGLVYFREVMVMEPDGYNLMVKENSGRLST